MKKLFADTYLQLILIEILIVNDQFLLFYTEATISIVDLNVLLGIHHIHREGWLLSLEEITCRVLITSDVSLGKLSSYTDFSLGRKQFVILLMGKFY